MAVALLSPTERGAGLSAPLLYLVKLNWIFKLTRG